ncbi:MAG: F0F1 ATP synthase subunit A [Fermentimonas sp.]|nr:F0F1 ATP synthase subunit A [Fermentimonas sp.]
MRQVLFLIVLFTFSIANYATGGENQDLNVSKTTVEEELNVKELILEHLADSYEWHLFNTKKNSVTIHLPVILYSKTSGWNIFLSSKLHNNDNNYKGFGIATEGKYKGKIVETSSSGEEVRPFDLSITKNAASLLLSSLILILIILGVSQSIKRDPLKPKKGFAGIMEMFIFMIVDEVIKPAIGEDYKRYSPYLLTLFFFIFFNNLLGLFPLFPGGANVTGNISVTLVLAIGTFLVINLTGSKKYYKDILWPDTPVWLKVPFPLMQIIELVGTLTKPFALMIRLFANIMAGHAIVLGLTSLVFVTVSLGSAINASMSVVSVIFTVFIDFVELLVAFIQAYVFTLLSSVFIGLAREKEPKNDKKELALEKLTEPVNHLEIKKEI